MLATPRCRALADVRPVVRHPSNRLAERFEVRDLFLAVFGLLELEVGAGVDHALVPLTLVASLRPVLHDEPLYALPLWFALPPF